MFVSSPALCVERVLDVCLIKACGNPHGEAGVRSTMTAACATSFATLVRPTNAFRLGFIGDVHGNLHISTFVDVNFAGDALEQRSALGVHLSFGSATFPLPYKVRPRNKRQLHSRPLRLSL